MRRLRLVLLLLAIAAPARSSTVTTKEIEEALTCQCGCGLTVHSCNHLQCGSAIPLKHEVSALVAEGLGHDEILLRFRDKYGEKILSSPTAEGFNLAAWILPFAAILAGGAVLGFTIRRWTRREADRGLPAVADISAAARRRLEAELRRGEQGG